MNLILWRHAEAEDVAASLRIQRSTDLQRELTKRGEKQAEKMAAWLRPRLPEDTRVLVSPAVRTQQTARALTEHFQTLPDIAPGADVSAILAAIDWPSSTNLLLVGHQPWLGRLASLLIAGVEMEWSVKKAAVWWLCRRMREDEAQTVLRAVVNPDLV
ncbi:phosphohistidine phosphatase SixA [Ralstonia insidiosa]|jgi:phosphohistidine phosphatase|uniref:phosphohistidine phosphatase SixA n=1 Tax=Ralstonia TaxID=48736 RepID=UPI0006648CA8|nr:phosphohistidine phosphatase SixA [Ralstonia insidiosa]KMW48022.1 phosphohistidine phosphatase [Ralstonia sp. MD27]MBX3770408.1 phosphohistidine phosphatase SixA [Ralstonia pickettii]NOZ17277.1 phosphohistidine phosphatase SixA [Betaproteobacteria bacterium]MBA9854565.1 phosphohistidine phosphatase SixA [Ralstonia insidiosa]MBA9868380.1 phosphohistidine phosphatase SixA [Ralstonia insidiosa]